MPEPYVIQTPKDEWDVVGDRTERSGQPVQRFRKEVTRTGVYRHPEDGWELDLTVDRNMKWADAFAKMQEAGVEVPLCDDHIVSAETARGNVVGYEIEGDKGYAIVEAVGDDAIRSIARNGASVYVEANVQDGIGNTYPEAITHIALTPTPVIPGMGDWVPIAASRQAQAAGKELTRARVARYYAASRHSPRAEDHDMTDELRKLIGLDDKADDAAMTAAIKGLQDKAGQVDDLTAKLATANTDIDALKAKVAELDKDDDAMDDEIAADRADVVDERIDKLVDEKRITPAVAASLKPLLSGTDKARPVAMLSRKHAPGGGQYLARQIIDALAQNDAAALAGEMTGGQGAHAMSRQTPAGDDDNKGPAKMEDQPQAIQDVFDVPTPGDK